MPKTVTVYEIGATIEGPDTWRARLAERQADVRDEKHADAAALGDPITVASHENELVVLRVDYFENYAGRFLSVEAKTRLGRVEANAFALFYARGPRTPRRSSRVSSETWIDTKQPKLDAWRS